MCDRACACSAEIARLRGELLDAKERNTHLAVRNLKLREELEAEIKTPWRRQLTKAHAEIERLRVDAERYRAMKASLPQDGSRGQCDAWNDMRVEIVRLREEIERLKEGS